MCHKEYYTTDFLKNIAYIEYIIANAMINFTLIEIARMIVPVKAQNANVLAICVNKNILPRTIRTVNMDLPPLHRFHSYMEQLSKLQFAFQFREL